VTVQATHQSARTKNAGPNVKTKKSNQTVSLETPDAKHPVVGHASRHHSPELILIGDDDPNICDSLAEVLRAENYAVRLADDGDEAVRQFLQGPPDLVLLDLNMPNLNGWEAFHIMAELHPYVPVIVITARPGQAARAAELGVDMLLEKPLDLLSLLETIRKLLAEPDTARFDNVLRLWRTRDHPGIQG
jgi:DNA-binding response OmpR family regulator